MTFNSFNIKRQAHKVSRQTSNNPFAHVWTNRGHRSSRSQSLPLDSRDIERADGAAENDSLAPMKQIMTAPGGGSYGSRGGIQTRESNSSGAATGSPLHEEDETDLAAHTDSFGTAGTVTDREKPNDSSVALTKASMAPSTADSGLKQRNLGSERALWTGGRDEPDDAHKAADEKPKDKNKKESMFKNPQPKEPYTVANQLQRTFLNSWINVLLVAAPVGIALHFTSVDPIAIFVVNFVAIVPLAAMLSFATEEIALRTGETLGGLLNATFGNAVELIVAVMALIKKEVVIVQTSLIGSILSNLLLVMGMCFFFGGLRRQEQFFNTTVAQTAASLLALAVGAVIVPTVFDAASITKQSDVAALSRGTAIILLVVYSAYLFFQLKTHQAVFSEESKKVEAKPFKYQRQRNAVGGALAQSAGVVMRGFENEQEREQERERMVTLMAKKNMDEDEDEEDPQLHFFVAIAVLAGSTVVIALCAEFLVDSIDYVTSKGNISKEFLGLILLPIVGNAAEHATAVTVAMKDKMDLAIGVAVGSSMQVALFLIPLLVVIGWGMGLDEMSLSFDIFQVAVLFVAVLLVNYLIADGKSHWLEGMLLMCLYAIIATCSWWYPA